MTGAVIFGCAGLALSPGERAFFRDADPWGFIVFARNLDTPDQIRRLTAGLRDSVGRDAPILIDQEGGRVQRLRPPHWRDWLPALEQVEASRSDFAERGMWIRSRLIAAELRDLGIDTNCAPICDVPTPDVHPIILNRCYGRDATRVAAIGRAVADGLLAGGVLPVLKHIPGHGRPVADSHLELPRTDAALADLAAQDFAPFRALADLPLGMTAHVVYDAIDAETAATLSPAAIGLIRQTIGFDGLLMTDDISMKALSDDVAGNSAAALAAGCDLILHCNGDPAEMRAVAAAAGRLTSVATRRSDRALTARRTPDPLDTADLLEELTAGLMLARDE
jgi:beta-N-acetylhexosaminidase